MDSGPLILDPAYPVDLGHPSNRGLAIWLTGDRRVPGVGSSPLWRNIGGRLRTANGVLTNGATWGAGPTTGRSAVAFDGSNDSVVLPGSTMPTSGNGSTYSYEILVRYASTGSNQVIVQQQPVNSAWLMMLEGGNLKIRGATASDVMLITAPAANVWHHLVVTWINSIPAVAYGDCRLYVDGVEVANGGATLSINWSNTGSQIDIGRGNDFAGYPLSGSVSMFRVYDRILSAGEIQRVYRDSLGGLGSEDGRLNFLKAWSFGVAASGGGFIDNTAPVLMHVLAG